VGQPSNARGLFIDRSARVWFDTPSGMLTVFGSYCVTADVAYPF
jgi:hypothetical protein